MKNLLIANRHSLPTWKCAGQISLKDMKIEPFVLSKLKDPFLSHLCRRKPWFMLISYQNTALKFLAPFFTKLHNLVAEAAFSREIRLESSARQKGGWGSAFNAVKEGHVTNYGAHWWTYLKIYNFNQQSTKSGDCTTLMEATDSYTIREELQILSKTQPSWRPQLRQSPPVSSEFLSISQ